MSPRPPFSLKWQCRVCVPGPIPAVVSHAGHRQRHLPRVQPGLDPRTGTWSGTPRSKGDTVLSSVVGAAWQRGSAPGLGSDNFSFWLPMEICPPGIEIRHFTTQITIQKDSFIKPGWGECLGEFYGFLYPISPKSRWKDRVSPQLKAFGGRRKIALQSAVGITFAASSKICFSSGFKSGVSRRRGGQREQAAASGQPPSPRLLASSRAAAGSGGQEGQTASSSRAATAVKNRSEGEFHISLLLFSSLSLPRNVGFTPPRSGQTVLLENRPSGKECINYKADGNRKAVGARCLPSFSRTSPAANPRGAPS